MASSGLRAAVLLLLCAQNSLYTLLRRYSRGVLKETVSSSAVLLAAEALKFFISAFLLEVGENEDNPYSLPSTSKNRSCQGRLAERLQSIANVLSNGRPMAVPAATYLLMNMLSFKAMELVDATVFAMFAQLKIMTTAVSCWIVLGRKLTVPQWRAIVVLTLSVLIITYQRSFAASQAKKLCPEQDGARETQEQPSGGDGAQALQFLAGVGMVVLEISLSGWISAYFEKYLKNGRFTVWGRNLQLAGWSMLTYGLIEVAQQISAAAEASEHPGAQVEAPAPPASSLAARIFGAPVIGGWSVVTCLLVLLGGGGGLLVAFAIKYADAVMKSMATAFALVVVVAAEILMLGAPADPVVCMAGIVAILGLQFYSEAPKDASASMVAKPPPTTPKYMEVSTVGKCEAQEMSDVEESHTIGSRGRSEWK